MDRLKKRALLYLVSLVVGILVFTVVYQYGMATWEGEPRSFPKALQIVVQTYTTVGYGQDATIWSTPQMNVLMTAMQILGVLHLFIALPLFVVPWLQSALQRSPPTSIPDLTDHVVVCRTLSLGERLVGELVGRDMPYVVIEPEMERARQLHAQGVNVIHGDPEEVETLDRAHIDAARAVVVDAEDDEAPSIVLGVRQVRPDLPITCIVRESEHASYMRYAGATTVLSPRELLGRSLAEQASTAVTDELGEAIELGEDLRILELPVMPDSPICDRRLADSHIRERTGASVVGVWLDGEFVASPSADVKLDERSVLLVAGDTAQLDDLRELTQSEERGRGPGTVVILGYGEVGQTADSVLEERGVATTVVHDQANGGVDVVGDATDENVLEEAGLDAARAVLIALPDDRTGMFAILVAREINPNVEIAVRANESESTRKMYRAGADYVLSLADVSGRMVARSVFDEDIVAPARQIKVLRAPGEGLAGDSLEEADVGNRTGCTVVAVEREDEVLTELGPGFVVEADDRVIVVGTDEDIQRFSETFGV